MGCAWFCPFSFGGISQCSGTVLVPGPLCMPFSCSLFSRENKTSTCTYKHRHLIMCLKCPSNSLMEVCRINTVFPYSSPNNASLLPVSVLNEQWLMQGVNCGHISLTHWQSKDGEFTLSLALLTESGWGHCPVPGSTGLSWAGWGLPARPVLAHQWDSGGRDGATGSPSTNVIECF